MGSGQDAPVYRDEMGSEVAFRRRAETCEFLFHLRKVAMGSPLVWSDIVTDVRVMGCCRRVVTGTAYAGL